MLETERLTIRRITPADYKEAFAWSGDARVNKYLLHNVLEKPEDMIPWLEGLDQSSGDSYITILHEKTDGHAVGTVGFSGILRQISGVLRIISGLMTGEGDTRPRRHGRSWIL